LRFAHRVSFATWGYWLPFVLVATLSCTDHAHAGPHAGPRAATENNAVQTQMRNVMYHFSSTVAVHIKSLDGQLDPAEPSGYPVFDNKDSFTVAISSAEITITANDLANVLNSYVFARPKAALSGLSVSIQNGRLKIKGCLHEAGAIPFATEGELSPTQDRKILLHAAKVKALYVPVKKILSLFGVEMSELIKSGKIPGVETHEDDLILDPALVFPPPHMHGKVTAIRIEGGAIVLTFGDKSKQGKNQQAGNYMSYRGNRLAFGKLLMTDADMNLIDMDSADPFDFYLDHYKEQLTAGYTKITPTFGLRVYMRDFNKLNKLNKSAQQKTKDVTAN
jgi:hypothetical protein